MPNWCNFWISVSGPETARKELKVWLQSLPQSPNEKEIVVSVPDTKTDDSHDEWFFTTLDSFAVEEGNRITVCGDCRWDPPLRFVQVMFCRFSELTYDCTSTTEYVQSERWRFCTKYPSGRLLELKGGFGSGYTLEPGERPEFRKNAYGFSLRFSGSVVAQSRVTEFVLARCEIDDDKHFIQHEHSRTYLWPEQEGVSATVIRQSNDQGELIIEGQDQATYGVTFAKELCEVLPNITIHVSADSPDKFSTRLDISNGQVTLVEYSGFIDFTDLNARSRYWLVKDGQALTREQRKACVDEGLVSFEKLMMQEWGIPSPLLHTPESQSVIQKTIDSFEVELARKLKTNQFSPQRRISELELIELLDDLKAEQGNDSEMRTDAPPPYSDDELDEEQTQKWNIDILGHVPYIRHIVVEVPAEWDEEDLESLSGRQLAALTDNLDWEVEMSVVVTDEIDVMGEADDDLEPDVTLNGDPAATTE